MDNRELRAFFEEILNVINYHENIPIEAKRLVLFCIFQIVERQANDAIAIEQREALIRAEKKEEGDAENLFKDKLEKLSGRDNSSK